MESIITLQKIDRCVVDLLKYIENNTTSTRPNNHTILPPHTDDSPPSISPLPPNEPTTNPTHHPSPLLLSPQIFSFATPYEALCYGRPIGATLYRRAKERRFDPNLVLQFMREVLAKGVILQDDEAEEKAPKRRKSLRGVKVVKGGGVRRAWSEVERAYFGGVCEQLAGRMELGGR